MFAGGRAEGGRGAPQPTEEIAACGAAGGGRLGGGRMGVGIRVLEYIYARFMGRPGSWAGQAGVWMGLFRVKWATIVFKWVAFSCRVRAGTACRDRGPDTAHHRVVSALTLRPSCRARVRVVFFSVVRRAARRVWPIWPSIATSQTNKLVESD
jgi:hypothetical protein